FKLYPNPANSGEPFYVEFPTANNLKGNIDNSILVVLLDQMGKEVYSSIIILQEDEVIIAFDPNEKLSSGMYFVIGSSNTEIYRHKLIIQ
ncbi:MAG: T9SS type A sorting domain-containing protein, partial [Bacteroidetes bacterium]|nr:T9SS type A sorting domain-containing protein [Bacteroidota bacterium]